MRKLFNNYEPDMLINEYVSPIEREEENDFINEVLQTPVMKSAMKFLQEKGLFVLLLTKIKSFFENCDKMRFTQVS